MRYRLVIFDLDGTLLDTIDDLAAALNAARRMNGLRQQDVSQVRSFVGNGVVKLIERSLEADPGIYDETLRDRLLKDNISYYASHCIGRTRPYDGIQALLGRLKGMNIMLACISNKDNRPSTMLVNRFFLGVFDYCTGSVEGVKRKPDPEVIDRCLSYLGVSPEDCVLIGDSDVDIATAVNAGISSISVGWGYRSREFLLESGAMSLCMNPLDLWQLLQ